MNQWSSLVSRFRAHGMFFFQPKKWPPETNIFAPKNGGFQVRNLRISRKPPFSGAKILVLGHEKKGGPECLLQDVVVLRPHAPFLRPTEVTGVCVSQMLNTWDIYLYMNG